ncbi:flagellar hook-basal body complex protein FliE [Desulfobulbus rhabdoformis]|jgi:flagellar hook-basal body complex protein FliE|uniref:flagellar hook-basal body complex protein FliE n=1 Tax=Desulfobulbus rhabdoformis TaxID=34032 RepID=UPI0019666116|nr:flagellar hook-basal body complex protein FliE [Desulfobulbus rhabdoformis]MBM9615160.1 flagellar hook-basal body complex protein FliE [Desulfobulbus rhabdoformis]
MIIQQALSASLTEVPKAGSDAAQVETSFGDVLSSLIQTTNTAQQQADNAVEQLHAGGEQSLHDAMLSMEKADISLRYMVQVRNKALDAYQEVMRMQV